MYMDNLLSEISNTSSNMQLVCPIIGCIYAKSFSGWWPEDSEEVNWLAFSFAFHWFHANDQRQLHKFLHDWLGSS